MDQAPRRLLTRLLLVAAMAALLLLLVTAPASARWPFVFVGAGCLAAIADGYAGAFAMLRRPRRAGRPALQLQICAIWLINMLAYFALLNVAAERTWPGTFEWRGEPASMLDVAYLTILTFSTGGLGDVTPVTGLGKVLVVLTSLGGLLYATVLVTGLWDRFQAE